MGLYEPEFPLRELVWIIYLARLWGFPIRDCDAFEHYRIALTSVRPFGFEGDRKMQAALLPLALKASEYVNQYVNIFPSAQQELADCEAALAHRPDDPEFRIVPPRPTRGRHLAGCRPSWAAIGGGPQKALAGR